MSADETAPWWVVLCPHCGERLDVTATTCHGCWKQVTA